MKLRVVLLFGVILSALHLSKSQHSVATGEVVEYEESTINESQKSIPTIINRFKFSTTKSISKKKHVGNGSGLSNSSRIVYNTGDAKKTWDKYSDSTKKDDENKSTMSGSSNANTNADDEKSSNDSTVLKKNYDRDSLKKYSGKKGRRRLYAWYLKKKNSVKKYFKKVDKLPNILKNYRNLTSGRLRFKKFHAWYSTKKNGFKKYMKKLGKVSFALKNYHHGNSTLNIFGGMRLKKLRAWLSQKKNSFRKLNKYGSLVKKSWHANRRKLKVILFSMRLWYRFHKRPNMKRPNMSGMNRPGARSMNRDFGNRGYNRQQLDARRRY